MKILENVSPLVSMNGGISQPQAQAEETMNGNILNISINPEDNQNDAESQASDQQLQSEHTSSQAASNQTPKKPTSSKSGHNESR